MAKSKQTAPSTNEEKPDNGSATPKEGMMVTTIASFLKADPDVPRSIDEILANYLEVHPRTKPADVNIGKREIASLCLYMLGKQYVTKTDDDKFQITEAGQELS